MTSPVHARVSKWGDRAYFIPLDGISLPSVTSILSGLDDSFILHKWIAKVCVEAAVADIEKLQRDLARDRDETIRQLKLAAERERDLAGARGSRIHKAAENLILGTGIKPRLQPGDLPYWESFLAWWREHGQHLKWLSSETTIVNRTFGYAGTLDAVVRWAGATGVMDFKTGRTIRSLWELQIAAYSYGETILLPDGRELAFNAPRGGWVLHIRPENEGGTLAIPMKADRATFDAFCSALDLYKYRRRVDDEVAHHAKQRATLAKKARADAKRRQPKLHVVKENA